MKNWKTTLAGALAAAGAAIMLIIQQGHDITDWKTWILPAALALLGYLAKDGAPAEAAKLLVLAGCGLSFSSCNVAISPDGTPTLGLDPVAAMNAYNAYTAKKGLPPVSVTVPVAPLSIVIPTK